MSPFELHGKTAIVTGASRSGGTGKAIAIEFAKAGADVVVAARNQEALDEVAEEIKALDRKCLAVATDICDADQVDNLVKQTLETFGRIDILVNNAGGILNFNKADTASASDWRTDIDFNLTGPFLCCAAAGKAMIEQKDGKIINISSCSGIIPSVLWPSYGAAKAGLNHLTTTLALGWAKHNINVNSICPGVIATEMNKSFGNLPPDEDADGNPVPRLRHAPDPQEIAFLAVFLSSRASDHITGETIQVGGPATTGRMVR